MFTIMQASRLMHITFMNIFFGKKRVKGRTAIGDSGWKTDFISKENRRHINLVQKYLLKMHCTGDHLA